MWYLQVCIAARAVELTIRGYDMGQQKNEKLGKQSYMEEKWETCLIIVSRPCVIFTGKSL